MSDEVCRFARSGPAAQERADRSRRPPTLVAWEIRRRGTASMKRLDIHRTDRLAEGPAAPTRWPASRLLGLLAILVALLCAAPAAAQASSSEVRQIMERCKNSGSLAGFSQKAYHEALAQMSPENIEYSNCSERIVEQELESASQGHGGGSHGSGGGAGTAGGAGGSGGGGSSGGGASGAAPSATPAAARTPEQQQAIAHAQKAPPASVSLGGGPEATVHPGVVHANVSSALSSLPAPLIAAIAAIAAMIAILLGRELRDRLGAVDEEA
ncbi:MAG: hypothetical protein ACYCU0_12575 [Solirubrobacteraceae bacterium]